MAVLSDFKTALDQALPEPFPSTYRQATYFATGAFAGSCTLPLEILSQRLSTNPTYRSLPAHALLESTLLRAGTRFWVFDHTRTQLQHSELPAALRGGISGATGGFVEVLVQSALRGKFPIGPACSQAAKLFLCFGSFTQLSTTLSPDQFPPSLPELLGSSIVAGGVGSAIMAQFNGARGSTLARHTALGMGIIGTVITLQVTTSAYLLKRIE